MSDEIHVIALCKAKPELVEETRAVLEPLIGPTLKEPGCIRYTLHVNRDNPTEFYFIETWAGQASLDRHFETPGTAALVKRLEDLLVEPATILTLSQLA